MSRTVQGDINSIKELKVLEIPTIDMVKRYGMNHRSECKTAVYDFGVITKQGDLTRKAEHT